MKISQKISPFILFLFSIKFQKKKRSKREQSHIHWNGNSYEKQGRDEFSGIFHFRWSLSTQALTCCGARRFLHIVRAKYFHAENSVNYHISLTTTTTRGFFCSAYVCDKSSEKSCCHKKFMTMKILLLLSLEFLTRLSKCFYMSTRLSSANLILFPVSLSFARLLLGNNTITNNEY